MIIVGEDLFQASKTTHVACKEQNRAGPSTPKQTGLVQILPHKKAFLRAMPIKDIVCFGWQFLRLAPTARVCYPEGHTSTTTTCVVVVYSCLQLRLIRHEFGASFFDVRASLKNYSRRLKRTKLYKSFSPKANKLLAGLEQILPHSNILKFLLIIFI